MDSNIALYQTEKQIEMKRKNIYFKVLLLLVATGFIFTTACTEEEDYPRTRLFQPVLNEDLYSVENTIVVDLGKMKEATAYKVEVSRDSFVSIDYSFETSENYFVLNSETVGEDLLWFTIYQVRVTAKADNQEFNSLPSFLGSVRTQKFPSNMGAPTFFDVLDTRARVFWTPSGSPITTIKVFSADDSRLQNPLSEFNLSAEEQAAAEMIVSGLSAATVYQIAIYSDDNVRGWEVYTTRDPLVSGDNVVDLTGRDTVVNLALVLPDVMDGSIVLLEGGKTYPAGGYLFDKSISFISGYSFTPALPIIDCTTNFDLSEGATVDYVTFKDIVLTAPNGFSGRYVFNIDKSGTIGEIKFESCIIRNLRGVTRIKGGDGTLDKFTIMNCQVDSIKDYGILTVDRDSWACNDILIQNSTLSKAISFMTSRNNSNSIIIDACTINEMPEKGRQMFRWRTASQSDVSNGIKITNTIWGHAWSTGVVEDFLVDGFDGLANTTWSIINTYTTSQFGYAVGKDEIPGFPSFTYSGLAADLWIDPYNGDFNIKDSSFGGKSNSGDPRWRVGL